MWVRINACLWGGLLGVEDAGVEGVFDGLGYGEGDAGELGDGVWTLTAESFRDLLMQRYGSISGACQSIGFASIPEAMAFYTTLQKEIYAA